MGAKDNSQVVIPHLLMEGVVRNDSVGDFCVLNIFFCFLNRQKGTSIQETVDRSTNQPQLIMLVEELPTQLFVAMEQIPQIEVTDLLKGLFALLLSTRYLT